MDKAGNAAGGISPSTKTEQEYAIPCFLIAAYELIAFFDVVRNSITEAAPSDALVPTCAYPPNVMYYLRIFVGIMGTD